MPQALPPPFGLSEDPIANRRTAFTDFERTTFGLRGLLPAVQASG
jgi:hypothetical protein